MAHETSIIEVPFAGGQDEGTQRDVLPFGQLSYLQNVRYRRGRRLGKRNGYTSLGTVDLSGSAIGGTPSIVTTFGDGYIAVDDRFYHYDEDGSAWGIEPFGLELGPTTGLLLENRWPQFLPAPTLAPIREPSELDLYTTGGSPLQTTASMAYWDGLIWVCWCYRSFSGGGLGTWLIRIVGVNPSDGRTVFKQTTTPLTGAGGVNDPQQAHLVATGSAGLALIYDHFTAGVKDGIRIQILTSRATRFNSTEYSVACTESAVAEYVGDSSHILITYADGTANTRTGKWSLTTQSFTTLTSSATTGGDIPTNLSVFGISGGTTWIGYEGSVTGFLRIRAYNSSLTLAGTSSSLAALFGYTPEVPILFAARAATPTTVTAILHTPGPGMVVCDFTSAAVRTGNEYVQGACRPISWPFNVGNETYVWARHDADAQVGVATLIRVPPSTELSGFTATKSLPIEATLDDEDIDEPVTIGVSGPTFPKPVATPMGYVACLTPTVQTIVGPGPATSKITLPLLVPVRHVSEGVYYRQPGAVQVLGKTFVPSAQPMFIDKGGAVEAGFIQAPSGADVPVTAGGGSMTAGATYQYTVVFEYEDASGRLERSAPCFPASIAMGASTEATFVFNALELSKKRVNADIYRTLANGTQFHLLMTVDATPGINANPSGGAAGSNQVTIVDDASDTVVGSNEKLYTQIGQELADSQFPACQFAAVGGERLWVGGGFKANVIQASKFFLPRMSVAFADDDAFRVMLPGDCTGLAYLDSVVAFTAEGIYVITGDGPDLAGVGSFTLTRLPFNVGCVNWRSVIATDEGVFFQSRRGLTLLPRGFAEPVHIEQVVQTLAAYPYITSAAAISTEHEGDAGRAERTVQWVCGDFSTEPTASRVVVYDTIRRLWSVDSLAGSPVVFATPWGGPRALATSYLSGATHPIRLQSTDYIDGNAAITMTVRTGDLRPWGTFAHGVVNRLGLILEPQSASTLSVAITTEHGSRTASRQYTGLAPDPDPGTTAYLDVELGNSTKRDVNFLRVEITDATSNSAGCALFGMVIEHDTKPQGFKLLAPRDRKT
jgi:hypothetical protein